MEGSKDGDEASDFDSKTSTEGTPVAPSTANDRDANKGIDIIDLVSEDDSDDVITTPKMTGAASAPQATELIQKVAQRISNGESYRIACEALGFNLNENKEYKGSFTSDYSRLQCQVRKIKGKQNKSLAKTNVRLVEQVKDLTFQLKYVKEQYRILKEKLDKCECSSSRKRKIGIPTHLQRKKTKSKHDYRINY